MSTTRRTARRRTAQWFYTRGEQLYQAGRYRKAAKRFARSIHREPGSPLAYAGRGLSLAHMKRSRRARSRRAVRNLERAMALAAERGYVDSPPWLARIAYESGRTYERLGQHYMALRCYAKALDLSTSGDTLAAYEILQRRGRVHLIVGQYQRAVDDLDRSITLAPGNSLAYLNRAQAYQALGDAAAAEEDLHAYLALADPTDDHYGEALARLAQPMT